MSHQSTMMNKQGDEEEEKMGRTGGWEKETQKRKNKVFSLQLSSTKLNNDCSAKLLVHVERRLLSVRTKMAGQWRTCHHAYGELFWSLRGRACFVWTGPTPGDGGVSQGTHPMAEPSRSRRRQGPILKLSRPALGRESVVGSVDQERMGVRQQALQFKGRQGGKIGRPAERPQCGPVCR